MGYFGWVFQLSRLALGKFPCIGASRFYKNSCQSGSACANDLPLYGVLDTRGQRHQPGSNPAVTQPGSDSPLFASTMNGEPRKHFTAHQWGPTLGQMLRSQGEKGWIAPQKRLEGKMGKTARSGCRAAHYHQACPYSPIVCSMEECKGTVAIS